MMLKEIVKPTSHSKSCSIFADKIVYYSSLMNYKVFSFLYFGISYYRNLDSKKTDYSN